MKNILLFSTLLIIAPTIKSQSLIALESGGTTSFYTKLDSAYYYAQDGDVIYMPGGSHSFTGTFQYNKRVNLIGAGHYPDSTTATGATFLSGSIRVTNAASGGMIQGIYLTGTLYFGNNASDGNVNGFSINRCNIHEIRLSYDGSTNGNATNVLIRENVIRNHLMGGYCTNLSVENCIIDGQVYHLFGAAWFRQNNFNWNSSYGMMNYVSSVSFENNIFRFNASGSFDYTGSSANYYSYNIFQASNSLNGSSINDNNQFGVSFTNMYVNAAGNFAYTSDYHLSTTSPAIGAGQGGQDCGIYGGNSPYKEGAVPMNPHIATKNISPGTNAQGEIPVTIKVTSQPN